MILVLSRLPWNGSYLLQMEQHSGNLYFSLEANWVLVPESEGRIRKCATCNSMSGWPITVET